MILFLPYERLCTLISHPGEMKQEIGRSEMPISLIENWLRNKNQKTINRENRKRRKVKERKLSCKKMQILEANNIVSTGVSDAALGPPGRGAHAEMTN